MQMQQAEASGTGNVIVQIGGDGNTVIAGTPHLTLTRPGRIARTVRSDPDTGKPHQIDVIRAETRSVEVVGRKAELASLTEWLHSTAAVSVRVMVGDAGVGKSRLALELIETVARAGWRAGFLTRSELRRFRGQQNLADWGWDKPVLAVVDYAPASVSYLREWLKELADNPIWEDEEVGSNRPLRLLLLARQAERDAGWWAVVLGHGHTAAVVGQLADPTPMILASIDDPRDRRAILTSTLKSLGSSARPPAPGDDPHFDRRLAEQTWGGVPLMLMMAATTAAETGFGRVLTMGSDKLSLALAGAEVERILKIVEGSGVSDQLSPLVKHMIAITVLRQGLDPLAACTAIEQESRALGYTVAGGAAVLRDALSAALPDSGGGIATVEPDMIGEAMLLSIWPTSDDATCDAVARAYKDDPIAVGGTVVRTCQDYVIRGHPHALVWLRKICAITDDLVSLIELSRAMPSKTVAMREVKVDLGKKTVDLAKNRPRTASGRSLLAAVLNDYAVGLTDLGRVDEALAAFNETVQTYRELAADRPDAFHPNLAMSLNNLSNQLSEQGQHQEALANVREATQIFRELAADRPDALRPDLASSLNNLSNRLSEQGQHQDALANVREATQIYRELAAERPDTFRPDLASSLHNLSNQLSEQGQHQEALANIREAVSIRRELAAERPDAFRPDLASSLNNLSNRLSEQGQHQEALAHIRQAVSIRRELAAERPDAFRPDLAISLNNLSLRLFEHGQHQESLPAIREATQIFRELAAKRPDAFCANLASSLHNLSLRLSEQGQHQEALAANRQAVSIRRELAAERPDAFRPDLARSLHNLSNRLSEQGQHQEALAQIRQAVSIRRELAAERPDAFRPDLARSLHNLSLRLSEQGRNQESFAATVDAVATLREPFLSLPDLYAKQMIALITYYRAMCRRSDKDPDEQLLAPLGTMVQRVKRQSANDQRGGHDD